MPQWIYRHYRGILIVSVLITLLSALAITRLRLDLDLLALMPRDKGPVGAFFEVTEHVGLQSLLVAMVSIPEDMPQPRAEALVMHLSEQYRKDPKIRRAEFHSPTIDLEAMAGQWLKRWPLLLTEDELAAVGRHLSDAAIARRVAQNKRLLTSPFALAAKPLVQIDPLGVLDAAANRMVPPSTGMIAIPGNGFFKSKSGDYMILLEPIEPPQNLEFSRVLMADLARIDAKAIADIQGPAVQSQTRPAVEYAGGYAIAVYDEAITKQDIQLTLISSLVALLLIFAWAFRTPRILVYVFTPLLAALVWTMGAAALVFGHLNILSCIFSCVLAGLGIDFAIHIVNRFFSAEAIAASPRNRLIHAFEETSSGIVVGAITTATGFIALGLSDFRGFRELGLITGIGLILCLVAMLVVLPAMLVWRSQRTGAQKTICIAGLGIRPVLNRLGKRPALVLAVVTATAIGLAIIGTQVQFDENLKNFRPADTRAFKAQARVTDWLRGASVAAMILADGPTEAAALEKSARIHTALAPLVDQGRLADVQSVSRYIPPPSVQRRNMAAIRSAPDVFDMNRTARSFRRAMDANGYRWMPVYDTYLNRLAAGLAQTAPLVPSALTLPPLDRAMAMFAYAAEGRHTVITYVRPNANMWSRTDIEAFTTLVTRQLAGAGINVADLRITGPTLVTGSMKSLVMNNLETALLFAVAGLAVVLICYYRNLLAVACALFPLGISLAAVSGIMVLFDVPFNFINVIVLPMIVGIGIDDGVHLTNTFLQTPSTRRTDEIIRTGRGVLLTSVTTMVGFGSILLSHYPGLRSMGAVAVIGVSTCLITSLTLLPQIFRIIDPRHLQPWVGSGRK